MRKRTTTMTTTGKRPRSSWRIPKSTPAGRSSGPSCGGRAIPKERTESALRRRGGSRAKAMAGCGEQSEVFRAMTRYYINDEASAVEEIVAHWATLGGSEAPGREGQRLNCEELHAEMLRTYAD